MQSDWWVAFKYPDHHATTKKKKPSGKPPPDNHNIRYDFSDDFDKPLAYTGHLDDSSSPLKMLCEEYYAYKKRKGTGWFVWNDEYLTGSCGPHAKCDGADKDKPCDYDSSLGHWACKEGLTSKKGKSCASANFAHSKGILYFDDNGGVYLCHSCPHFPNVGEEYTNFPDTAKIYGQSFLALRLPPLGVKTVLKHLLTLWPWIQDMGFDSSLQSDYPDAAMIADIGGPGDPDDAKFGRTQAKWSGWDKEGPILEGPIKTTGGTTFMFVTKPCGQQVSIFDHIAGQLGKKILVESWIRGSAEPTTDQVCNVTEVTPATGDDKDVFGERNDHSKYFASEDGTVFGIGDLNRMTTQHKRGGGFLIATKGGALAQSILGRFTDTECSKGGFAPAPLPLPAPPPAPTPALVTRYEYYPGSPPEKGCSKRWMIFLVVAFVVLLGLALAAVYADAAKKKKAPAESAAALAAGQTTLTAPTA